MCRVCACAGGPPSSRLLRKVWLRNAFWASFVISGSGFLRERRCSLVTVCDAGVSASVSRAALCQLGGPRLRAVSRAGRSSVAQCPAALPVGPWPRVFCASNWTPLCRAVETHRQSRLRLTVTVEAPALGGPRTVPGPEVLGCWRARLGAGGRSGPDLSPFSPGMVHRHLRLGNLPPQSLHSFPLSESGPFAHGGLR